MYLEVSQQVAWERAQRASMNIPPLLFSDEFNSAFKSFFVQLSQTRPGYVTFIDANQDENRLHEVYRGISDSWQVTS